MSLSNLISRNKPEDLVQTALSRIKYSHFKLPLSVQNHEQIKAKLVAYFSRFFDVLPHTSKADSLVWDIQAKEHLNLHEQTTFSSHAQEADLHTDSGYRPQPEQWIALHCLRPAKCGGGINRLLLLDDLLTALMAEQPDLIEALTQIKMPIRIPDVFQSEHQSAYVYAPILSLAPLQIRYRYDTLLRGLQDHGLTRHSREYQLLTGLQKTIAALPFKSIHLQAGECLLINNYQTFHARTAFEDTQRHLLRLRLNPRT